MKKEKVICLISILLLVFSLSFSLLFGSVGVDAKSLFKAALSGPNSLAGSIFYYSRLPRTVGTLLAGFALAISGGILQSVLGNKLAAPGIIGVNAGAGFAVTLCCALGFLSGWAISFSSFVGALLSSICVMIISRKIKASRSTVLLAGVSMNYILGAFSDVITTIIPKVSLLSGDFRVGGFSSLSYVRLLPASLMIIISAVIVFTLNNDLEVLSLGDDEAKALGMNTNLMRVIFLILAALLSGAAVSFAGLLGFVGLVVPNGVRRFLDGKNRLFLPLSGILGGCLVTICDTLSRIIFKPYEIPVGIILALIGGPFFLYMVLKRGNK